MERDINELQKIGHEVQNLLADHSLTNGEVLIIFASLISHTAYTCESTSGTSFRQVIQDFKEMLDTNVPHIQALLDFASSKSSRVH